MNSRRHFLRHAAALPLLGLTACRWGRKTEEQPSPNPAKNIIGHGNFRYKVDKDWGTLDPGSYPVEHCHEMVMDSRGRLILTTVSSRQDVLVYTRDGKPAEAWSLGLTEAHGLTTAGEGENQTFWITDTAGRVINVDLEGRIIRELQPPAGHTPPGKRYRPTGTAVAANGDIYVADGYGSDKIFHYDARGRLINVFGGPNDFDCCRGIAVDSRWGREELLITSQGRNEFQRWSTDGKHEMTRKLPGLQICRPVVDGAYTYFAVASTKSPTTYDGMLAVLDRDFNVISLPGGSAPLNQEDFTSVVADGQTFLNPHDVCIDKDDNLYVPQWYSGRTYPVRLKRV